MSHFESLLWERRPQRVSRTRVDSPQRLTVDDRSEFTALPPGRHGRRLLAEVETYLEFFALAHAPSGER